MVRESEDAIRRLAAQQAVTRTLVEATTVEEAEAGVVRAICDRLGWDVGVAWTIHPESGELRAAYVWEEPSSPPSPAFVEATRAAQLRPGEGLPGRVWETGRPAWISDLTRDRNFPRADAALRDGLRAGFAFASMAEGEVLTVLEFFDRRPLAPDPMLLETAAAIGDQIGLFILRRRADEARHDVEERYRLLAETSTDAIVMIDASSTILSANPAVERIFGYPPAELLGRPLTMLMPPDMRERHERGIERFLATGQRSISWNGVPLPGLRRDGTTVPLEISFGTFLRGGRRMFTGIMRDVSERAEQQRRLEETAAELEATLAEVERQRREAETARSDALEAARWSSFVAEAGKALGSSLARDDVLETLVELVVPTVADYCAVHLLDADGTLRRVAGAGLEESEAVREYARRYPTQPSEPIGIARVARTGAPELYPELSERELRRLADDEEKLRALEALGLESAAVVPLTARGRIHGVMVLLMAGSGRRFHADGLARFEELANRAALAVDNAELYEAALVANRAKANFLAIMSHELRTPLTAIMGYSDLLDAGVSGELNERQREHLTRIMFSARHLLQLIDEILTYSRLEVGREKPRIERIPLREFVRETGFLIRPAAAEKHLRFRVSVPDTDTELETDPEKLRQALLNILFNAVKFTREGGVSLSARVDDGAVIFDVADTGIGIGPEHMERIFEPFWQVEEAMTRREGGTGLGLSVARRLVELLGGEIRVRSEPGQGTTFSIRIPAHAPEAEE